MNRKITLTTIFIIAFFNAISGQTTRYECENMTLSGGAEVETLSRYSNGVGVWVSSASGTTGTSSFTFSGTTGIYDVIVGHVIENDGQVPYVFSVNATEVDSWTGDLGTSYADATTRAISDVTITNGDVISLTSTRISGVFGRQDYIELTFKQVLSIEDEFQNNQIRVYPNPVTGKDNVTIDFSFRLGSKAEIYIYDLTGKIVKQLNRDFKNGETNKIILDRANELSGLNNSLYIYKIRVGDYTKSGKLIFIK